jgi:hypothetical protein
MTVSFRGVLVGRRGSRAKAPAVAQVASFAVTAAAFPHVVA